MTTTIKVSSDLRDRLKDQARSSGCTLGEHLARLAELADRQQRFGQLHAAISATPPEALDSYRQELLAWSQIDRD